MSNTVTLAEAKAGLEDLIERARRGKDWLITGGDGNPVAKLAALSGETVPVISLKGSDAALFGLMPGIKLLPGWDDPLEEFAEYT